VHNIVIARVFVVAICRIFIVVVVVKVAKVEIPNVTNAAPQVLFGEVWSGGDFVVRLGELLRLLFIVVREACRRAGAYPSMGKGRNTGGKALGDGSGVEL
jgi:hypothetical protein